MTIVRVDDDEEYGPIVHVYISNLNIPNPDAPQGKTTYIAHMPFVDEILEEYVGEVESVTKQLPDYEDGYQLWRAAFDEGDAGVFTVSVAKAIGFVQDSIGQ